MSSYLRFTALLVLMSSAIWYASSELSKYTANDHVREQRAKLAAGEKPQAKAITLSDETERLRKLSEAEPKNAQAKLALAKSLVIEAEMNRNPQILMMAIAAYNDLLSLEPSNTDALLALGNISFDLGVFERAANYLKSYLVLRPEDTKAQTDYALALLRLGKPDESIEVLNALIIENPDLFPARLSLALAKHMSGQPDMALAEAQLALKLAPNDEAKSRVMQLINRIENPTPKATAATSSEKLSPAMLVDSYFRQHKIIGPKLEGISWTDSNSVSISLRDFPVNQMPEVAKQSFMAKTRNALSSLPAKTKITLVDAETSAALLELVAGESADGKK